MRVASQFGVMDLESATAQTIAKSVEGELRMDEAAFRMFYEQSAPRLFAYLLRVSGERALAEDLLQEAYCRRNFLLWTTLRDGVILFRIATNLVRDRWRRHRETPLPDDLVETASADLRFDRDRFDQKLDRRLWMRHAFGQLKPRERQLLWLAYVEGSSHKEIAEAMRLRTGSVRLLLFRARRRLAGLIGGVHRLSDREVRK